MRTHGRYSTYTNGGCRCAECQDARRQYRAGLKSKPNSQRAEQSKECAVCGAEFNRHSWESQREWGRRRLCSRSCVGVVAGSNKPHAIGHRRLVAATCPKCGILKDGGKFRVGRNGTSHVCNACLKARERGKPGALEKYREMGREQGKRVNDASRERAHRNGAQWTGPELEVISRPDLTQAEMARMLGRTIAAVNGARVRVRNDPKWARVVGLPQASIDRTP